MGGGFGQAFASTLLAGQQILQQRDFMEERKKELDLRLKLFDLEAEKITRHVTGQNRLNDLVMGQSTPVADIEHGMATGEAPPTTMLQSPGANLQDPNVQRQVAMLLAGMGDTSMLKSLMAPPGEDKGFTLSPGQTRFNSQGQPIVQAPMPEVDPAKLIGMFQAATSAATMRTQGQAVPMPPGVTLGEPTALPSIIEFGMTLDAQGQPTYSLRTGNYKGDVLTRPAAGGGVEYVQALTNPQTGETIFRPIGPAVPAPEAQRIAQTVQSWGGVPRTPSYGMAVADLNAAMSFDGAERNNAIAKVEQHYRQLFQRERGGKPTATPAAGVDLSGVPAATKAEEITQAATKAEATKRAEQKVPERPTEGQREKAVTELTAVDQLGLLRSLYKPEFVGKFVGRLGGSAVALGMASRQRGEFLTQLNTTRNAVIRGFAGANMTPAEEARIISQTPDETLEPKQFEVRMELTAINAKIQAIRRRQVLAGSGVDVSGLPEVRLTTTERQKVSAPIAADYMADLIPREEAAAQLMGLAQYSPADAAGILNTWDLSRSKR